MKNQILNYISKGYRVSLYFSDGNKMIFSNVLNVLESDNAIELDNGDNTTSYVINLHHVIYVTPVEKRKHQKIGF